MMSKFNFIEISGLSILIEHINASSSVLFGFRIGVGILPLIFIAGASIALYFYPLHGKKLKQIKTDLEIYHKKVGVFDKINLEK